MHWLIYVFATAVALCVAMPVLHSELSTFSTGARSASLGGATVTTVDIFAVYNNQAAMGFLDKPTVAINYQNLYLLPDLHLSTAAFAMPVPYAGTAGISICSFNALSYNELRAGISIGKHLGEHFAVGTQVNYNRVGINGYGSTGAITAELGILAHPFKNLWLGAHVYNVTYSKFLSTSYNVSLPVIFNIGAGYQIIDEAAVFLQNEFHSGQNMRIKSGIEYFVLPALALRIGAALKPVELFAGVGYSFQGITIDFAVARHESLGYSPQISLVYSFRKQNK